jgi:preprotein translocase subunit SecB
MNNKTNDSPEAQPAIVINGQYVKDLSFESPNGPMSLAGKTNPPKIDISINLEARGTGEDLYEVTIQSVVKANLDDKVIFLLELSYSGLFTITNFNDEQKELILLIHCPTILFPFVRRIISDVTRDGGFQPLMVDPVDFNALYRQRKEEEAAAKN